MRLPPLNDFLLNNLSTKGWVYDIESFPNFFCVTFFNNKQYIQFKVGFGENQIPELIEFIDKKVLIGYNNLSFDDIVLNYIALKKDNLLKSIDPEKQIFEAVKHIVQSHDRQYGKDDDKLKEWKYYKKSYHSIDLMRIGNFQKSLKLLAVALKHHRIQDLPLPWNENIIKEDIQLILDYNRNDVDITFKLLAYVNEDGKSVHREQIALRYDLSLEYDLFLLNDSDSGLANKLLQKFYKQELGDDIDFDKLRTSREDICLKDVISDKVVFQTKTLQSFLERLKSVTLYKSKDYHHKFPQLRFNDKLYTLGVGGLHSDDNAKAFKSGDRLIIDADVASYYPSMMLNFKIKPAHLGEEFFRILGNLRDVRIEAKKKKDKVKSDGLKIVINSIFGKLGFGGGFLYDQFAMYQVTINGQLFLLMLIEDLESQGIEVISANTDGIVSLVEKDKENLYKEICQKWSEKLGFELEFTYYNYYIRRDVNNYLAVDQKDKTKSKGAFLQTINLSAGFNYPVIRTGLYEYFVKGKDYKEYLKTYPDILDFCMSQKVGPQFSEVLYGNDQVQKSVRFYASTNGRKLYKIKNNAKHDLCAGRLITVFNDYEKLDDYHIDYDYYVKEIEKIINEVESTKVIQEALF